jgi:thioredoxin reductase
VTQFCQTAIVGAGPYGLSLAAHLAAAGADFRIFGKAMDTWRHHMPKGMSLKSDGFATNISAPDSHSTLKTWSRLHGVAYDDRLVPVTLSNFNGYSTWFQKRHVPMLEEEMVMGLTQGPRGFVLTLSNGEVLEAARVVLAVGITWFKNLPEILEGLPAALVSHSYDHSDMAALKGQDVLVLGAGSSAVDTAVLAAEAGAHVTLAGRRAAIDYHSSPDPDAQSWLQSIANPSTGIGPGWRSLFCAKAPQLFRHLPENLRLEATRRHLGPATGWFMRGRLPEEMTRLGLSFEGAAVQGSKVSVSARGRDGKAITLKADKVIAATGFRPDLRRLTFLDEALRGRIAHVAHTPRLSAQFETTVPGLFVTGPMAANAFGPLMRFMVGAEYAAPRLAQHLARGSRQLRAAA